VDDRELECSEEQHPAVARTATVEAENKLVQAGRREFSTTPWCVQRSHRLVSVSRLRDCGASNSAGSGV
jgi:hypothetical protein